MSSIFTRKIGQPKQPKQTIFSQKSPYLTYNKRNQLVPANTTIKENIGVIPQQPIQFASTPITRMNILRKKIVAAAPNSTTPVVISSVEKNIKEEGQGQGQEKQKEKGLILVFDLDETILSHSKKSYTEDSLNSRILEILRIAQEKKATGEVEGIFLLTNNSDKKFIDFIHEMIKTKLGVKGDIFDNIHYRENKSGTRKRITKTRRIKKRYTNNINKALASIGGKENEKYENISYSVYLKRAEDIRIMLNEIGHNYENAEKDIEDILLRTYFFDDAPNTMILDEHQLTSELYALAEKLGRDDIRKHFIHITPPFKSNDTDKTDYTPIASVLGITIEPIVKTKFARISRLPVQQRGGTRKRYRVIKRKTMRYSKK